MDVNNTKTQLFQTLYEELLQFYTGEENIRKYEEWKVEREENTNEIQEERT